MDKKELTIVTAFYDCGRGNHASQKRTNDDYIEYFKFWARIRNKVIIYTMPELVDKISKVREDFGLSDRTVIISDIDIWNVEKDILDHMQQIEDNGYFEKWRYKTKDISNQAKYSYIMLMKYWCLFDASQRKLIDNNAVWVDFGWNHGGQVFIHEEEFDFMWRYGFAEDKIHLFAKDDPRNSHGILNLQLMTDCIMGCPFVCNKDMTEKLYVFVKEAMTSLLSLDCFDDDQMLLLMAYKKHMDEFQVHISDWFLPMKEYGGEHLTVAENRSEGVSVLSLIKMNGIKLLIQKCFLKVCYKMNYESYDYFKRMKVIIDRERP